MTDAELFGTYTGFERGEGGVPKLAPPAGRPPVSDETLYRLFLKYAAGITGTWADRLWAEERARRVQRGG